MSSHHSSSHPTRRRHIALAMGVVFALSSASAQANLSGLMNKMYFQASSPDVYRSQTRLGLVGGSFTARIPSTTINVVTFDPPRLAFGCGSIDMYGGSFSFINSDQLIAIFRNIPQIAVAALFRLATKSLSEKLDGLMAEFGTTLRDLNRMLKNSCLIGDKIAAASGVTDVTEDAAAGLGKAIGALKGSFSDAFGSWLQPPNKVTQVPPADRDIPAVGNLVWRHIVAKNAIAKFKFLGVSGLTQEKAALLVLNITGTKVNYDKNAKPDATTADCGGAGSACKQPSGEIPPIAAATLRNMLLAPEANDAVQGCSDTWLSDELACQRSIPQTINMSNIVGNGVRAWINEAFFGDASANPGYNNGNLGGIAGYVLGSTPALSDSAKALLKQSSIPALRHLLVVQKSPEAVYQLAETLSQVVADDIVDQMMDSLAEVARYAAAGSTEIAFPPDFKKNLATFNSDLLKFKSNIDERVARHNALVTMVEKLANSLPGALVAMAAPPGVSFKR